MSFGRIGEFATINIYPKDIYPADKKFLVEAKTKHGEGVYSNNATWQCRMIGISE